MKIITPMKIKYMDIREHNKERAISKDEHTPLNYREERLFDPRPQPDQEVSDKRKAEFLGNIRNVLPNAVINTSSALSQRVSKLCA